MLRRYLLAGLACSTAIAVAAACGSDDGSLFVEASRDAGNDGGGTGPGFGDGGEGDGGDDTEGDAGQVGVLTAVVRDFRKWNGDGGATNPDFENIADIEALATDNRGLSEANLQWGPFAMASDGTAIAQARFVEDIVQGTLDDAGLPVYTATPFDGGAARTHTTHGAQYFNEWYRDIPGRNVRVEIPLTLTFDAVSGQYVYDSAAVGVPLADAAAGGDDPTHKEFFPIDDGTDASTTFGNEGDAHNYSFTVELRTKFTYKGTETFTFSGDDDVFVFINKKLAINIGGIHEAFKKTISLPDQAAALGLERGKEYTLDFFQAERHKTESNLRIETTIDLRPSGLK